MQAERKSQWRRPPRLNELTQSAISDNQSTLEQELARRESAQERLAESYEDFIRRGSINTYLVVAILLMILAMVALYFSLCLFKPEFARQIIRQRVLIELLSMGFLLLTVIILGTGGVLNSTALAALLGTISGYIFGRKTKRRPGRRKEHPVRRESEAGEAPPR